MSKALLTTALLFSGLSHAANTISNVTSSDCPSAGGAHIIVARASTEQEGYGIIGAVKDQVISRVPGSNAEFVVYPATLGDYTNSETDGVVGMRTLVTNFVNKCTGFPLVLMGYSQGAQVLADVLAGQQVGGFPDNSTVDQPLPASTLSRVTAAILMGDPTFLVNETFHVGNATHNGDFPRRNGDNFNANGLASRIQSYCDANDPYCAAGNFSTGLSVHLGYVQEYGQAAEDFVVAQIKSYYGQTTAKSTGNGTSTPPTSTKNGSYSGMSYSMVATGMPGMTPTVMPSETPSGTVVPSTGAASSVHALEMFVTVGGALCAGLMMWML